MEEAKEQEKLSRKEKEHLFRRKEILAASLKLFAAKGYEGASMQEIASASEFSIGTLYNFFSTKEDLFVTLIEEMCRDSRTLVEGRVAEVDGPLERIGEAVKAVLLFMDENREFFMLFMSLQAMPDYAVHNNVREKLRRYHEMDFLFFANLMADAVKAGALKSADPRELAMALTGIVHTWIYNWLKGPGDKRLVDEHGKILDIFLNGAKRPKKQERDK